MLPAKGTLASPAGLALTAALALPLLVGCERRDIPPPVETTVSNVPSSSGLSNETPKVPVAATAPKPDVQKLKGKWLRPDGEYVLEIRNAEESGRLEAYYFNPRPIHVARAEATREGDLTKVFVELRDVNYPGSTYTLVYDPENRQLKGIYFQAVERQNFEVLFVKMQ
jgi:hypothetical protein